MSDLSRRATDFTPVAADRTHARIIWDCAWAPDDSYFVTVSRDKQLKTWSAVEGNGEIWKQLSSTKLKESVTAVDIVRDEARERCVTLRNREHALPNFCLHCSDLLVVGLEDGSMIVYSSTQHGTKINELKQLDRR